MPRPFRLRRVGFHPHITHFKPAGVRLAGMEEVVLTVDEFEAIRLKDYENLDQTAAAKKMNISQPTFARLLDTARKKVAQAIVGGKAIRIQGGHFKMVQPRARMGPARGMGRGRGRGFGPGPGGVCVCPKCKAEVPQVRGQPCISRKCPKCGTMMVRR